MQEQKDFPTEPSKWTQESVADVKTSSELVEEIRKRDEWTDSVQSTMYHFFVDMAINNTVVVSAHPHYDKVLYESFYC